MFYPNDHERACQLIRFTRKEDENGKLALPKTSSASKRTSLKLIAPTFDHQNSMSTANELWNEAPLVKDVKPTSSKF